MTDTGANGDWAVYILRCTDGSYYVGITQDIARRVSAHNAGRGARYTALRRPITLAHQERMVNRADAEARERQLKRWSRAKKRALVENDSAALQALSISRD